METIVEVEFTAEKDLGILEEAKSVTRAAQRWLVEHYGLHSVIVISPNEIKILSDELYTPTELPDVI